MSVDFCWYQRILVYRLTTVILIFARELIDHGICCLFSVEIAAIGDAVRPGATV